MEKPGGSFQGLYEIEDGYFGKSRPKYFTISESDLADDMTDKDMEDFYHLCAQDHFEQHCYPQVSRIEQFLQWARATINTRRGLK